MDIRPIDANALLAKPGNKKKVTEYDENGYAMTYQAVPQVKIDDAPTLSLNALRDAIYEDAVAHGLWERTDYTVEKAIKEAERCGDPFVDTDSVLRSWAMEPLRKEINELEMASESEEEYAEELADVIIMSMSIAGKMGINIDAAIRRKMQINKERSWKHENE